MNLLLKKKMKTQKFHSNDQAKLKIVCDDLCDHIDELLDYFNLDYKNNYKMITMACPIHGGDNASALNIYPEGETYRGNWKCRSHNCDKVFKSSIIGFIRGVISHTKYNWSKEGDSTCSFEEALNFALAFIKKDLSSIKVSKTQKDKMAFTHSINYIKNSPIEHSNLPNRTQVRQALEIPAQYYIDRQYTREILDKYDIGLCNKVGKEMYNRVVVPVYNNDYTNLIGCSGRSIYDKCNDCGAYHTVDSACPLHEDRWLFPKWKHSANFKSQNSLYNFWFAKEYIKKSNTAIIVESPGNVWRLEENGIHNSVAIFGSSLSDRQKIILDSSGAMTLVILTDNDEAGRKAAEQIKNKCQNTYKILIPLISKSDVAEMDSNDIDKEIKPFLKDCI